MLSLSMVFRFEGLTHSVVKRVGVVHVLEMQYMRARHVCGF
jgi:hypothetical protein